jgi:phosphatidate cytidylyltransferase
MSLANRLKSGDLSRWVVGILLIVPTLFCVFYSNKLYLLFFVALVGTLTWGEFFINLLGRDRLGLLLLSLLGFYATLVGATFFGSDGQTLGLVLSLVLGAAYFLHILTPQQDRVSVNLLGRFALGHLYLTFGLSFIMLIKQFENGPKWLLFVILITAANDTGAYLIGSKLKGPKLVPVISPNKTISGLLGGCLVATVIGGLSQYYIPGNYGWRELAALGLFLSLWGTFGDLFESAFKRAMGIKDTSTLLAGHGGFWDRLDSLLFTIPPVYFYVFWRTLP